MGAATGIPLRHLQDWRALGWLLLISSLAGAVAWTLADAHLARDGTLPRLFVGGASLAAVYGALWLTSNVAGARLPIAGDQHIEP